jgi:hypothetical protein
MPEECGRCGKDIRPEEERVLLCAACGATQSRALADDLPQYDIPEYDHRGILLPARSRVGGIITPQ